MDKAELYIYDMMHIQRHFTIRAVNKGIFNRRPNTEEKRQMLELNFGDMLEKLRRLTPGRWKSYHFQIFFGESLPYICYNSQIKR